MYTTESVQPVQRPNHIYIATSACGTTKMNSLVRVERARSETGYGYEDEECASEPLSGCPLLGRMSWACKARLRWVERSGSLMPVLPVTRAGSIQGQVISHHGVSA